MDFEFLLFINRFRFLVLNEALSSSIRSLRLISCRNHNTQQITAKPVSEISIACNADNFPPDPNPISKVQRGIISNNSPTPKKVVRKDCIALI